jgi:PKD repeat protein
VNVTNTDACNGVGSSTPILINVNPTPTADASFSQTNGSFTVQFLNNSTNASSYSWDFGDGTTATGVTTTHTYTAAGAFTARLTITDNEGSTDTTTHEITVAAPGFGLRVTDDSGAVVWTVAGLFNNNKNVHVKYSSDGKVRKISGAATDVDPVGVRTNVSFSVIRTKHSSEYTGSIRIQRSDGAVKKFRFQVVGGVTTIAGGGATGQGSSKVCEDHDCAKWTLDWVVNKPLAVVHKERPSGSRGMTRAML